MSLTFEPIPVPAIPAGYRQIPHTERTVAGDQVWDFHRGTWITIGQAFINLRASTFTCVIRKA